MSGIQMTHTASNKRLSLAEWKASVYGANDNTAPTIACDYDGNFVLAWQMQNYSGSAGPFP